MSAIRRIPLTEAQAGIWYAQQLDPDNPIYNTAEYIEILGPLDLDTFQRAVRQMVTETRTLTASFNEGEEGPYQMIDDQASWELEIIDVSELSDPEKSAVHWMQMDLRTPVDLRNDLIFAEALYKIGEDRYFWYQRIHHIAIDGFGVTQLIRRAAQIYTAFVQNELPVPSKFGSIATILDMEAAYRSSEQKAADRSFWLAHYENGIEIPSLAQDASASGQADSFFRESLYLSDSCCSQLQLASKEIGAVWSEVIVAAIAAYMHRLTGSDKLVFGLPMMNRAGAGVLSVPSTVMNVVPLHLHLDTEHTFRELVQQTASSIRQVGKHQTYRHEELRRDLKLGLKAQNLYGPIINIMPFESVLKWGKMAKGAVHNLAAGPVENLTFNIYGSADGKKLRFDMDANPLLYSRSDIRQHLLRLSAYIENLASGRPDHFYHHSELLLPDEKELILHKWNAPEAAEIEEKQVTEWFEEQAARTPDHIAVSYNNQSITYDELNNRVNRLARLLIQKGAGPERIVAILLNRSIDMVVSMLAVLKSGAAYMPLDPEFPGDRLHYMLTDANPVSLITETEMYGSSFIPDQLSMLIMDDPHFIEELAVCSGHNLTEAEASAHGSISPDHPAYVIYTSGSTGKPKGVVVHRGGVSNFLIAMQDLIKVSEADRMLAVTTVSFDIAVLELFLPLLHGAETVIAPKRTIQDPEAFSKLVSKTGITMIQATPTLWQTIVLSCPEKIAGMKILVGGEALSKELYESFEQLRCEVVNLYGPTETTIWSSAALLWERSGQAPVIGSPIRNTQMYILDSRLEPLPPGIIGDLYIAGNGLARGYLNRPELTAERFIANPFGAPGTRMYQTGDLARWLADGTIDYIGRSDHQLKIRGYRIELGEIESVMMSHPSVLQSAVAARTDDSGEQRLVAYVVADSNRELAASDLRSYAGEQLPEYMVPSAVVFMEELPLTPNAKLDRKALPAPDFSIEASARHPRTPQEELLAELFAEILRLPRVGIDDSFFDLGGHSLLAGRLLLRIRDVFDKDISIVHLFEAPTVAKLAKKLTIAERTRPSIQLARRPVELPLSFAQKRIWFQHLLEGPTPTYNIPAVIEITGDLDMSALQLAFYDVTNRHESLHTVYPGKQGTAKQLILPAEDRVPHFQITEIEEAELSAKMDEAVKYSFEIEKEVPVRAELFVLSPDQYVLVLLLHHIACDGWSLTPLLSDLAEAYKSRTAGKAPAYAPLPLQYSDYAVWQEEWLSGRVQEAGNPLTEQLSYWKEALAQMPEELELIRNRQRTPESGNPGGIVTLEVSPKLHEQLTKLAKDTKSSLFMVLQSGLAALLTRLGAGHDIPIGSPIAGRNDDQLTDMIGMFINNLVLRSDTSGNPTFRQLVDRVRKGDLAAFENQDVPFEQIVEQLNPSRVSGRHPLFQIMFAFQNTPEPVLEIPGLLTKVEVMNTGSAKFDLTLELREHRTEQGAPCGIHGWFEYNASLYDEETVQCMAGWFLKLLESAATDPDKPIETLAMLETSERQLMLELGTPAAPEIAKTTIKEWFEHQASLSGTNTAITYEGESLTYEELNARSNQLAHLLIHQGVGPEKIVALALPRSITMIIGILAVIKSGGAYLPLDPEYPQDRLSYMIHDAAPECLITHTDVSSKIPGVEGIPQIVMDDKSMMDLLDTLSSQNPDKDELLAPLSPESTAYIIYTSGSTGKPKGVMIPHQNVVRLFKATDESYSFNDGDVWTLFHSYAFDFSVWEIWGALLYGGRLVIVPHVITRTPAEFLTLLIKEQVTVLNQTPSAFYSLMQADQEKGNTSEELSLRYVIFGGEALELGRLKSWYSRHPEKAPLLVNMYGITETTVHVTFNPLNQEAASSRSQSLIGEPISDLKLYVLDDYLQPVPWGITGEMYVAGSGLARGYLGRPSLTAERFIADPYGKPGDMMYRTGDLARWTLDGNLDYIGRADHQVKIRGFRIELGEIETVIAEHSSALQTAVIVREDQIGDKRLVAYIVPSSAELPDTIEIKRSLGAALPDYMIPSAFVVMNSLPLTANGKLDKKALPAPDYGQLVSSRGPRNPQEELLCDLFAEVLGLPGVGIDDGFFDLGGHSLLAVKLMSLIHDALGVQLGIGNLFEAPTVAKLCERLEGGDSLSALSVLLPLRKSGEEPPLFCIHPAGGLSWCYAGLMKTLPVSVPIYGLQARGIGKKEQLPATIEEMAADYIKHIREVHPKGPYRLAGWSLGGNVAHAVAVQLEAAGEEVEIMVMLDAYPGHFLPLGKGPDDEEALIALLALGGYDPDTLDNQKLTLEHALKILQRDGSALASLTEETILNLKDAYVNSVRILGSYVPGKFNGELLFFRSTIIPDWFEPIDPDTWKPYIGGNMIRHDIECRHKDMCQAGPLEEIGRIVAARLMETSKVYI
ncbi:amino acid adenylation domain-containing protein [Neobacillus mesonae]|nr:amino acid adenylation domain-containing protein [Neobacillus mesonae]